MGNTVTDKSWTSRLTTHRLIFILSNIEVAIQYKKYTKQIMITLPQSSISTKIAYLE